MLLSSKALVSLIFTVIMMLNAAIFVQIVYNKRFPLKRIALFALSAGIISSIPVELVNYLGAQLKFVLVFSAVIVFLKLFFKLHFTQCLLVFGLFAILQAFGNVLAFIIFFVFGVADVLAKNDVLLLVLANVVINITNIIAFLVIRSFKVFATLPREVKIRAYTTTIIYIIFTLLIISINIGFYYDFSQKNINGSALALNAGIILCYAVFSVLNSSTFLKLESKNQELDYQIFYNKTLDRLTTDLRRFKHNYSNALNVIGGCISSNDWKELKEYFNELVSANRETDGFNNMVLLNIKNAGILGLFVSKLDYAKDAGVNIKIVVHDEIREVKMKIYELCEMLGILLDNAIEAAAASLGKMVNIDITNTGGVTTFRFENSTDTLPDIRKMFEKGYSTKGDNRGLGLWVVKKVVDKSGNVLLNTKAEQGIVRQELIIDING